MYQDFKAIRVVEGTKISHDISDDVITTFSYRDLCQRGIPAIGIPCRPNNLVIIDVDVPSAQHKKDGREWWQKFCRENGIPPTYTVQTRSGGFHFYFRLPDAINPDTFAPPASLAPGVDIKWNGFVVAPPTSGYGIFWGNISQVAFAPASLIMEMNLRKNNAPVKEYDFDFNSYDSVLNLHTPFSIEQIEDLKKRIDWTQANANLSYSEWRDGLFALKAGISDPALLHDLAVKWTFNRSYTPGDEHQALDIIQRAEVHGGVGPGTIFSLIKKHMQMNDVSTIAASPFTIQEILHRAGMTPKYNQEGKLTIDPTETNVAAILGAMFPLKDLYHDVRMDQYMFQGKIVSDVDLVNKIIPIIQSEKEGLSLRLFKKQIIATGIEVLLIKRRVDPHKIWLESLKWDGIHRVDSFFADYVGAEDTEYTRIVSKNFWISLAGRGVRPGLKVDSMVILEGHEGIRKSSLVQAIGGEYTFAPSSNALMTDTDDLRRMHQSIIVELPELMGLVGQDPNKVKAFLTKPFDHIRALYSKKAIKVDRGFIFIGTTNSDKYLGFDMGIRRFLPIKIPDTVKTIPLEKIIADRDQLFAEALHRFNQNESFYEMPTAIHATAVRTRVKFEPLMGPVQTVLGHLGHSFTLEEIYLRLEMSGFINRGFTPQLVARLEVALRALGFSETLIKGEMKWGFSKAPSLADLL